MKKAFLLLISIMFLGSSLAYGFELGYKYDAKTGDKELDMTLGNLNMEVGSDKDSFVKDLNISYGIPKVEIEDLIYKIKMPPADVYMTIKIGSLINKPIDVIVKEYEVNKKNGWGVIAKQLGIKPGSEAFHALKKGASAELGKAEGRKKTKASKGNKKN